MAKRLIGSLPTGCILIADRLYGVGAFVCLLVARFAEVPGHFLVRVKGNLKSKLIERCADGSALVEIKLSGGQGKLLVREIRGKAPPRRQMGRGALWTSLLEWKQYPPAELLGLYARRWEQEIMYKELKVDMRQAELVRSHTVETAAQEIAALVLAYTILAQQRLDTNKTADGDVLRISFGKVIALVRPLWIVLAAGEGILSIKQKAAMTRRVLQLIVEMALPPRRKRSCPRAA